MSPAKNKAGDWLQQGMVNPVLNCNSNFRFLDSSWSRRKTRLAIGSCNVCWNQFWIAAIILVFETVLAKTAPAWKKAGDWLIRLNDIESSYSCSNDYDIYIWNARILQPPMAKDSLGFRYKDNAWHCFVLKCHSKTFFYKVPLLSLVIREWKREEENPERVHFNRVYRGFVVMKSDDQSFSQWVSQSVSQKILVSCRSEWPFHNRS